MWVDPVVLSFFALTCTSRIGSMLTSTIYLSKKNATHSLSADVPFSSPFRCPGTSSSRIVVRFSFQFQTRWTVLEVIRPEEKMNRDRSLWTREERRGNIRTSSSPLMLVVGRQRKRASEGKRERMKASTIPFTFLLFFSHSEKTDMWSFTRGRPFLLFDSVSDVEFYISLCSPRNTRASLERILFGGEIHRLAARCRFRAKICVDGLASFRLSVSIVVVGLEVDDYETIVNTPSIGTVRLFAWNVFQINAQ